MNLDLYSKFVSKENLIQSFNYLEKEIDESSLPLDPIWKPAMISIKNLGDDFLESLSVYIQSNHYVAEKPDFIYASKENLGVRPICALSVIDRLIYQALFNPHILGNLIDKKLFSFCYGNRINGKKDFLKPYKEQWYLFCEKQKEAFKEGFVWRVEFDMETYFENIHLGTLFTILKESFSIHDEKLLGILQNQLNMWVENPSIPQGVPQGAKSSQILANAYLYPLDKLINELMKDKSFKYFRYVDDIVIMSESPDKANTIIEEIVLFLRNYNLRLNSKTKLEKLKSTKSIEEQQFYNDYGTVNQSSAQKLDEIKSKLPNIFYKIKSGEELDKVEKGNLNYYLKSFTSFETSDFADELISIIPYRPSLISLICKSLGFYLSSFFVSEKQLVKRYNKILNIYFSSSLTQWAKFWILKLLSVPDFTVNDTSFQKELVTILSNDKAKFLRVVALSYKAYIGQQIYTEGNLGFSIDDIRRLISSSNTEVERAVYFYFLLFLKSSEDEETLTELIYEALDSKSPEVQLIGIFLLKQLDLKLDRKVNGKLCKIHFKQPLTDLVIDKNNNLKHPDSMAEYFVFEGRIPYTQFIGMSNLASNNKTITASPSEFSTPKGWALEHDPVMKKAYIKKDKDIVFTFPHDWTMKFAYFKCLWENYGKYVSYPTLFKAYNLRDEYPKKLVAKTNADIRSQINKLRKERDFNKLPFKVETNKGIKLSIINIPSK